jgi:endonuclease G, mitochondrial
MNGRRTCVLLLLCLVSLVPVANAASANIVMSQVYGGGGSGTAGTAYTNDYVELFNSSTSSVTIAGWSLQYGSSTGQFGNSGNIYTFPAGTSIPAGKYLLVKLGAAGAAGATIPFDLTSSGLSMAAGSGKVALVTSGTALGCGATATPCALPDSRIVDVVAWGASNNGEGSTTVNNGTVLNSTNGAIRKSDGCQDTDNNRDDFIVAGVGGGLVPRNSSSAGHSCGVSNLAPSITAPSDPIATVAQDSGAFTVSLSGFDDGGVYVWSATAGSGVSSVTVSGGQGTANVSYDVTLQSGFSGQASFTAALSDSVNPAATRTVNIAVTPTVPNEAPSITPFANPVGTVDQDAAPFQVSFSGLDDNGAYSWSAAAGAGVQNVSVSAGQATANVTYTVTLVPGFSGTAAFTVSLSDGANAPVTSAVTVTVVAPPPPPLDHIVISQVYGGGGNSGATYQNDFVELYNPTTSAVDLGGWTIQYASATGTGLWQPQPLGGVMQPGEYYLVKLATNGVIGAVLPDANINGTLNLSGTNGKVALVNNGDALEGCPVGQEMVVDLVGYGTTANCREGATNAPVLTNAKAAFRRNGGFTDTNVNGADFEALTPNPRRTTPIVEIGPYVLSTDPRRNVTSGPRDANITVNFTEAVDVTGNWFDISCATTGQHNDATIGGSGLSWIIVPNVNFQPGEVCTVTIFKNQIHDQDLDDDAPNTDTLTANYTWSFSIATGTAPAYGPEVHLTMGNPTDAETDLLTPLNFLMMKPELALSYNRDNGTPNWVSWHLDDTWVGSLARVDTFRADPAVPAEWYRVLSTDYFGSGFDRGHMVPNADRDPATSMPINQATFLMTNMIPQAPDNNQGPWANMENYLRTLLPANELYIVAGGSGVGGTGSSGFMTTFANGNVTVPALTWKVALVLPKASGDDVGRVTAAARTIAVILPNTQGIRNVAWETYLTSVDQVEALTGYDFFENVADAVENSIEAGINGVNPPGVENQSISLSEDGERTFTLESVSPNAAPLTYTIVSGPTHGTLSGSGASQTYTPAPDFNGSDSFTFRVSNGTATSNVGTMTITVLEVNDTPVAAGDFYVTDEDATLTFNASELVANDTTGAANENGQTLTVSGVTTTASTNGTVSLNAGTVTYTPAANFFGAASFTYQVCDNGVTGGLTSPQCTSATVTVNVTSVNDVPVITAVSGPSAQLAVGSSATISVSFNDSDAADTHAATFTWSDGATSTGSCAAGNCTTQRTFAAAGIYQVAIVVTDAAGATDSSTYAPVIVYDTNAGFVTGGGWFSSPSGKASLNVNVKYLKGAAAPTGQTKFEVAGLSLNSTSHDWLVVSGSTAQYRGRGTVNGAGDYTFDVTVTDAASDTFRITIRDTATNAVVYDSTSVSLGGGNITVH